MARVNVREPVALDDPVLVEGLPGVGLVGKIATDHLVDSLDMTYHASVDCDGIPRVAVYGDGERDVRSPVRIYADEANDLLALQSDVPISRSGATGFADCVTGWLDEHDATPLFLSGLPVEDQDPAEVPSVFGVACGSAGPILDEHDVGLPPEDGVLAGPTGALVNRAAGNGLDAIGLVVESDPQFPDPAAARQLLVQGIEPVAEIEVGTDALVDRAEEIRDQKEKLAQRMGEAGEEESSQAQPLRMFQ